MKLECTFCLWKRKICYWHFSLFISNENSVRILTLVVFAEHDRDGCLSWWKPTCLMTYMNCIQNEGIKKMTTKKKKSALLCMNIFFTCHLQGLLKLSLIFVWKKIYVYHFHFNISVGKFFSNLRFSNLQPREDGRKNFENEIDSKLWNS